MQSPATLPDGRVALITGGTVRIGRAITERLAARGFAVAVHARASSPSARQLIDSILASGGRAMIVDGDLADPTIVETLIPKAAEQLGPVTLLINNASQFCQDEVSSLSWPLWDAHFAVNLRAPAFLMRDMARHLPDNMTGAVINIIDQRVLKLTPQFASYTLTKASLWTATKTFAQALAPRIRVNAVAPGPTLRNRRQTAGDFKRESRSVLLGRGVAPYEIAEAVVYLAEARSVTGQMIAVDGGQHLAWQTPDV